MERAPNHTKEQTITAVSIESTDGSIRAEHLIIDSRGKPKLVTYESQQKIINETKEEEK